MDYIKRLLPSSRPNTPESAQDFHEVRMQKYEQHIQKTPYGPYNDSDPIYYGGLFYNMKNRIYLAVGLTFLLGITLPAVVIFVMDTDDAVNNYGDCMVPEEYRFQYDVNQVSNWYQNLENCTNAKGCWNISEPADFRCYHSYPSGDQYFLSEDASLTNKRRNDQESQRELVEETIGIDSTYILKLDPVHNYHDERPNYNLRSLNFQLYWHNEDVFSMDFYPPTVTVPPKVTQRNGTVDDIQVKIPTKAGSLFYIQIFRGKEVIFDTMLGPMRFTEGNMTFSTLLPTRDFYGLKGGQGTERMATVDGVTTFGQNELPFYMVREESGSMHAVLIETTKPFVAQIIGRPGISFHFEGDFKNAFTSIKFFKGPTAQAILEQLSSYLKLKNGILKTSMPPYWALGVHLCRKANTTEAILDDIAKLNRESSTDSLPAIPYDSDCIAEELRNPFKVNSELFHDLERVIDKLNATSRRLLVTQRLSMLNQTVSEMVQASPELVEMFILSPANNSLPVTAAVDNKTVNYLSVFNPKSQEWIQEKFETPSDIGGLVLIDNFPRNENASYDRIWNLPANKNSRIYANFSSQPWGVVAPDAAHRMNATETVLHADLHNAYGHESLKTFQDVVVATGTERSLVVTSSVAAESFLYGAYTGPQVSFSWNGLRDSLENFLRYFMFLPFSGIPVCGSWIEDVKGNVTLDQELCLRWYQAALLLPFVRNTYGDANGKSRGPLDLNGVYQRHLVQNIKDRYAINPYYYTLFYQYSLTDIPPVTPISYYFPNDQNKNETTFHIADQLMIGPALMAAPLVYPGTSRTVYFPSGIWYTVDGDLAYSDPDSSRLVTVSALIHHVPMFIRQGHIVPTLLNPIGQTAEETRVKTTYTILATYPSEQVPSKGQLYLDDGVTVDPEDFELITFSLDRSKFSLKVEGDAGDVNLSRVINDIRIFGAPTRPKSVHSSVSNANLPTKNVTWNGGVLTLTDLGIDWKEHGDVTLTFEY